MAKQSGSNAYWPRGQKAYAFRTSSEEHCIPAIWSANLDGAPPAAIVLNPERTPLSVAISASARAGLLRKTLFAWALVGNSGEATASDVADILEPMAQEVELLLADLVAQLSPAEIGAMRQAPEPGA